MMEWMSRAPFSLSPQDRRWVEETFRSLSLEEKVGQVFVLLCDELSEEKMQYVLGLKPGGIHRFPNGVSWETLASSAVFLQEHSRVPLLLTGDLEFSFFAVKIGDEGSEFQTQMGVAASSDPLRDVERMARIAAREGRALGYNVTFSPVVDINYNFRSTITGTRTFGSDADMVRRLSEVYVRVLQEEGMGACAKHWPGDGVDDRDQHLVTSCNSLSRDVWEASYGEVYRGVIQAGVQSIMSAHICAPALVDGPDRFVPASLSGDLTITFLRERLGFNGVVISDATPMAGFASQGKREDLLPRALDAGCDIILFSEDPEEDVQIVLDAVKSGRVAPERLDEAVLRILAWKAALGLHRVEDWSSHVRGLMEEARASREEHARWAEECFASSITLVKHENDILPISPQRYRRVLLLESRPPEVFGPSGFTPFKDYLEQEGFWVTRMEADVLPDPDLYDLAIYLLDHYTFMSEGRASIPWAELHGGAFRSMWRFWDDIPTVMISLSSPYFLFEAPTVGTYVNVYSPAEVGLKVLVDLLMGRREFRGRNPVDPFCGMEDVRGSCGG
ncbi:putative glycosyl hydrolase [Spirochaeta thermophila DSM 6192]|uniref:beta-N-acetylhexosaminidase n=2 Tax=Winmispira thermophila TaxID=154 RepID=E0RTA6_WINT6|nr:putative glycosyl hydrolase [Spirochaeta thermophila DSM 6192]